MNKNLAVNEIEKVQQFWNAHPCGSDNSTNEDRKKYYQEVESHRYGKIRSIHGVADFDKYKGKRVLEVGCGVGTDGRQFSKNGALYCGINLDEGSTLLASEGFKVMELDGEVRQMNAEDMEFPDNSFDHIYSHGVIHHSPDTEKIVGEMYRVLKPGGTINVMVYNRTSINYYFEIMFLRKLFRLALYPKFAPGLFSKILGFEKQKLEKHRDIMIREKMTKDRWISINTDGPDCPLAKVYNKREINTIFCKKGFQDIQNHVRYFNKQHYSFIGKLIPNTVADKIGNVAGWHRWVKAVKPIS